MKYTIISVALIALVFCFTTEANSQVTNPAKKVKEKGVDRTNSGIDRTIDKGYDKLEEGVGNLFRKKDKQENDPETTDESAEKGQPVEAGAQDKGKSGPALSWSKYDFVPGDEVIFEDILTGEENGEFPSRWDLWRGNVEIAELDGEKVIMMRDGSPAIIACCKEPAGDQLPDIFTIEFDLI